ncbi:ankyrin repeat domain-containing protein [Candidatus Babeliales bacterium]|nr:ankyrin repeat domain-containing protein [Candidatus Babeliales bacterium]
MKKLVLAFSLFCFLLSFPTLFCAADDSFDELFLPEVIEVTFEEKPGLIPPDSIDRVQLWPSAERELSDFEVLKNSPLQAVKNNDILELKRILQEPSMVDLEDREEVFGKTALHIASQFCLTEIVELLLNAGALVNVQDKSGNTPLHYAAGWGFVEIVALLVEKGQACQDITNLKRETPVMLAVRNGRFSELCNYLKIYY